MYEAWDSFGKRRVELARRAFDISKDCADAYVLLAEETARSLNEAKDLYEQGVRAGERGLGSQFEEYVGHFWGIMETRPYMRARAGLAQCLWMLGGRQQAIEHYTDMLRLNPNDNQGIRYILANCLLEEGSDDALWKLLEQYEDDAAATWLYSRALWVFRQGGVSEKANRHLKEALGGNRFVPSYLLGKKRLPKRLPEYIGLGDENEAIAYAAEAMKAWQKTEGALEWLRRNLSFKEGVQ
jgi:tetratricopeptide (TPR) repeat protein